MKTFKVRVVKASGKGYWYTDKVGQIFDVINMGGIKDYKCTGESIEGEPACNFFIDKSDCEIVEDTTKKELWEISIDDGFCEWRFPIKISDRNCIDEVYKKITELFGSPGFGGRWVPREGR